MKTKRSNKKILPFFAMVVLLLSLIISSFAPATNAAAAKIIVTDHDASGDFSVGDEFCLGQECFYIIENTDGNIRALAKYNLNVGGDTVKVSDNPDYQNQTYNQLHANRIRDGYIACKTSYAGYNELTNEDYYDASICYKSYERNYTSVDISNRTDLVDITTENFWNIINSEYENIYDCFYDQTYKQNPETSNWQYYTSRVYLCYSYDELADLNVHQSSDMISAHGDIKGKPVFPSRGDYYFDNGGFYDANNNIITSDDYRQDHIDYGYTESNYAVSRYLYDYVDLLQEKQNIDSIDLLSYNDLMHILNAINQVDAVFEDDNYKDEVSNFEWQEQTDEDNIHNYSYWFSSMLDYIPEQYSWLYSTTYWLATTWYWDTPSTSVDEYGNEGVWRSMNYQFFVDTLGDLCSVSGSCGEVSIGAGIRPVITISEDLFELNTTFNIDGTVRWIDDNNASNIRPEISVIHLFRNGVEIASAQVAKSDNDDLWHFTFTNLLKYDYDGNEYVYTVSQDNIPQYSSDITNFDIVNSYGPSNPDTIDNIAIYGILGSITTVTAIAGFVAKRTRR